MKKLVLAIMLLGSINTFASEVKTISGTKKLRSFVTSGGAVASQCFSNLISGPDFQLLVATGQPMMALRITKNEKRNPDAPYRFETLHGAHFIVSKDANDCDLNQQDIEIINYLKD